jgi:hypothetical protein
LRASRKSIGFRRKPRLRLLDRLWFGGSFGFLPSPVGSPHTDPLDPHFTPSPESHLSLSTSLDLSLKISLSRHSLCGSFGRTTKKKKEEMEKKRRSSTGLLSTVKKKRRKRKERKEKEKKMDKGEKRENY